jgi:hypothetical protein
VRVLLLHRALLRVLRLYLLRVMHRVRVLLEREQPPALAELPVRYSG